MQLSNSELPSLSMKLSNYFALTDFDLPDGNLFHSPTLNSTLDTFEKHLFLFCSHINGLNMDLNLLVIDINIWKFVLIL